jgi:hypothetical protein
MKERIRVRKGASNMERIQFYARPDASGCWLWAGYVSRDGYGTVSAGKRMHKAHRMSYEAFVGPIPEGLDIDHLCRVRNCVNPEHLEPVTRQVNCLRGDTVAAKHAATTHCPQGHEYTPENTYSSKRGERDCRACRRVRNREWARKKVRERRAVR